MNNITAKYFCENISSGNTIFWTVENDNELIGELKGIEYRHDKRQ